jgi:hypothetical protein
MNLQQDLRDIINNKFAELGLTYNTTDLRELCIDFFNTALKLIPEKHYTVHYSAELTAKKTGEPYEAVLTAIQRELETGVNICPHLSKQSLRPDYDDSLLNDWQIHHLHLSTTKASPTQYFYDRSDQLLFVLILDSNAYFIDVRHHNEQTVFARKDFIRIIQNNWEFIIESSQIKDAVGVSHDCTDEEIAKLRKAGVNVLIMVNGKVYVSQGMGYAASGDSMKAVMTTQNILKHIDQKEKEINSKLDDIKMQITDLGKTIPDNLDFKLELNEDNQFVIKIVGTDLLYS